MSESKQGLADWTMGAEAIVYQSCASCGSLQYFRRELLRRLRRAGSGREARQRRGHGLCDLAGLSRRHAGNPRACSLQHRPGRYVGRLSHDGPWRQRSCHRRSRHRAVHAVRRPPRSLFREMTARGAADRKRRGGVILKPALHPTPSRIAVCVMLRNPRTLSLVSRSSPPGGERAILIASRTQAGDDEHRRHRQHLRKCLRGRPLCGYLHAYLPRLGHDSSSRASARFDGQIFYSERPTPKIRFDQSPHSANIDDAEVRPVMRRHFGPGAAGLCAWRGIFKAYFWRAHVQSERRRRLPGPVGAGYCLRETC